MVLVRHLNLSAKETEFVLSTMSSVKQLKILRDLIVCLPNVSFHIKTPVDAGNTIFLPKRTSIPEEARFA